MQSRRGASSVLSFIPRLAGALCVLGLCLILHRPAIALVTDPALKCVDIAMSSAPAELKTAIDRAKPEILRQCIQDYPYPCHVEGDSDTRPSCTASYFGLTKPRVQSGVCVASLLQLDGEPNIPLWAPPSSPGRCPATDKLTAETGWPYVQAAKISPADFLKAMAAIATINVSAPNTLGDLTPSERGPWVKMLGPVDLEVREYRQACDQITLRIADDAAGSPKLASLGGDYC